MPFCIEDLPDRQWPARRIERAPLWCSVDLRDGNQALVKPMNMEQKLEMFKSLCEIGVKEIEVGFPSASQTDFDIVRALIEQNLIPDDVRIQVLVQAREHLIRRTFDAIRGVKMVYVHLYNSTSELQRRVVFKKDRDGITQIAVDAARLMKELADGDEFKDTDIKFVYSPESFTGTEGEYAVEICSRVLDALGADSENRVVLNLPATVEGSTPNKYADQVEYFCRHIDRSRAIVSIHPHNDRGTAVAAAELGLLAGAERIEGTLFGNGERTGNVDLVTLALNMYTQGIDPMLDFHNINEVRDMYERTTGMEVSKRHPYAGELVFTAFSGSHQDAISKGEQYMRENNCEIWQVPYIPICPADIGRDYEPIIRINSQSGKSGAAFVMSEVFGYYLPKKMQSDFGAAVKNHCDETGMELNPDDVFTIFSKEYLEVKSPYALVANKFTEHYDEAFTSPVITFNGSISCNGGAAVQITGEGNGPVDAFFNALKKINISGYNFVDYHQHAVSVGSDAKGICYVMLEKDGKRHFGVGISHNTNYASIRAVLCAINRSMK
ncbi:MAG: 2-isopropylmalate synthase [Clostridia bacterium]|nr:2-isopropylmalate synthase [Clostridia bacterium]